MVKFISYHNINPASDLFCKGILKLEVNGVLYTFGDVFEKNEDFTNRHLAFWSPQCITCCDEENYGYEYQQCKYFKVNKDELPDDLQPYADEIQAVLKEEDFYNCNECLS